jgi:hypothetical protein
MKNHDQVSKLCFGRRLREVPASAPGWDVGSEGGDVMAISAHLAKRAPPNGASAASE